MSSAILSNHDLVEIGKMGNLNVIVLNHHDLQGIKKLIDGIYIFNINANTSMGHWVILFVDNRQAYYFDSFGIVPSNEIISLLKRSKLKWSYNKNDIQHISDTACGYYCLAYASFMKNNPQINIKHRMQQFASMFMNDTQKNRGVLRKYIETHFT